MATLQPDTCRLWQRGSSVAGAACGQSDLAPFWCLTAHDDAYMMHAGTVFVWSHQHHEQAPGVAFSCMTACLTPCE